MISHTRHAISAAIAVESASQPISGTNTSSAALGNDLSANRSHPTHASAHSGFGGRSGVGGGSNGISLPESVGTFGLLRSSAASDGSCSVG